MQDDILRKFVWFNVSWRIKLDLTQVELLISIEQSYLIIIDIVSVPLQDAHFI